MQFGRYHVVRMIGQGGMATVYEACDPRLNQRVAIKVLHAALATSAEIVARFEVEARIVNGIHHPGIVVIYDLARLRDGAVYHVMEFLEGETLAQRIARRVTTRMDMDEICRIVRQIADTLCTVHFHGIVHRDLKPDNLMLVPDAFVPGGVRVKILDFGLAKILNDNAKPNSIDTQVGMGLGTVDYIAPEQILDARNANDRADVYALGCILFELAAGRKPFVGDTSVKVLGGHLTRPAPDLLEVVPGLPRSLAELVAAMLAKEPAQRPSMRHVMRHLDSLWGAWVRQSSDTIIMKPGSISLVPANRMERSDFKTIPAPRRMQRALPVLAVSAALACLPWLVMIKSGLTRAVQAFTQPIGVEESKLQLAPSSHRAETESHPSLTRGSITNVSGLVLR